MNGLVAKRLRQSAKRVSKGENAWRRTYKHLKAVYNKTGSIDVIGNNERLKKAEKASKDGE